MNYAHLHLILNHAPLYFLVFAFCLSMYSIRKRSNEVAKIAMFTFVIAAFMSMGTYFSGENAEPVIDILKDVNKKAFQDHEKIAKIANVLTIINGSICLSWFFVKSEYTKRYILIGLTALSLMSIGYMSKTANLGGQIRHTEIGDVLFDLSSDKNKLKNDSQSDHGEK